MNIKFRKQNFSYLAILLLIITAGFLSCKRSILHQTNREYDARLIKVLRKLERRYTDKKVRINTWDQKADAYTDLDVLNEDNQSIQTLTIGDSVKFLSLDFSQPDGIRAEITTSQSNGYIPYWKVEEFEQAKSFDPDLKE